MQMTRQLSKSPQSGVGAVFAALAVACAWPASAQTSPPGTAATATADAASAAQKQKDADTARELTVAAFSRRAAAPPPGGPAAQIAADSAKAKVAAPPEPKPEWLSKEGLQAGGKGVEIRTPF